MQNKFAKGKVISEFKNDKPWKKIFFKRTWPVPYFRLLFKIFQIPLPPAEVIKIHFLFNKGEGGQNYVKPDSVLINPIGKDGVQSWLM